jgi:hypothetical protein
MKIQFPFWTESLLYKLDMFESSEYVRWEGREGKGRERTGRRDREGDKERENTTGEHSVQVQT